MMRRGVFVGVLALAWASVAQAASPLSVNVNPNPGAISQGQEVTVVLQVSNLSATNTVFAVSTTAAPFGSASVSMTAAPNPTSRDLAPSTATSFTWRFLSLSCGSVAFSGSATGSDSGTVSANGTCSAIPVACVTPTATATATPWVVYSTATPSPLQGDASIPGNLYHPDQGSLQLKFDAPAEGTVTIEIFNRLGQRVRSIERSVMPGSYTELWDGRSDQGLLVASGIYAAQFRGKGLFKAVKFAVVK